MEIGTWSNAMADNIESNGNSSDEEGEWDRMLPSNLTICSRKKCMLIQHFLLLLLYI